MDEDKGLPPSQKKLEKSKREGRILRAPQVGAIIAITSWIAWVNFRGSQIIVSLSSVLELCLAPSVDSATSCLKAGSSVVLSMVVPVLAFIAALSVGVEVGLGGRVFLPALVAPSFARLDPATGLSRMGSGLGEVLLIGAKLLAGLIALALGLCCAIAWAAFATAQGMHGWLGLQVPLQRLLWGGALLLTIAGGVDLWRAVRKFRRQLSMSYAEVRQENKEEEGDPHVKGVRRSLHEALVMQELKARVRRSRVIVVERG